MSRTPAEAGSCSRAEVETAPGMSSRARALIATGVFLAGGALYRSVRVTVKGGPKLDRLPLRRILVL